jgi:DNA invertase Pin-like site-specific DNA recombinase
MRTVSDMWPIHMRVALYARVSTDIQEARRSAGISAKKWRVKE